MKINLNTMLLLVGLPLIVYVSSAFAHTDVTAEQAHELIDTTDDLIVVDVREPHEYNGTGGHIPGALNYPLNSGVLQEKYKELPIDGPILVVCRSGGRSNRAAEFLDSKGFSMVYDMQGGMSAWKWETETDVDPDSKYGGGTGEPNDPFLIYTAEQLNAVGAEPNDWDKHFKLMADIDLSGYTYERAVIAYDVNDAHGDYQGTAFTGIFDGNGHTVLHLTMMGGDYLGLFGQLDFGAMVSNLGLEVVDVNGGDFGRTVGGLVGQNYGRITMSFCTGTVISRFGTGGLVGKNWGNINNCNSSCSVSGWEQIGGLVGSNYGNILASCSTGTVTADEDLGGLVGINWRDAQIANCYSNCNVSGRRQVGGLVGSNRSNITLSYSTGTVIGEGIAGGLAGESSGSITMSFWDMETSNQVLSEGGEGKTTAEMQTANTFLNAGWDFVGVADNGTEDIWSICEGTNYPRFVWQIPVGDFICPDGITTEDFFFLLEFWLFDNCDSSNDFCQGTDLDQSGKVDENDLEIFFESWLAEK